FTIVSTKASEEVIFWVFTASLSVASSVRSASSVISSSPVRRRPLPCGLGFVFISLRKAEHLESMVRALRVSIEFRKRFHLVRYFETAIIVALRPWSGSDQRTTAERGREGGENGRPDGAGVRRADLHRG